MPTLRHPPRGRSRSPLAGVSRSRAEPRLVVGRLVVAAVVAAGCGGERLYPLTLVVNLADGRPAAGGSVMLRRDEAPLVTAGGRVGTDGACAPIVPGRTSAGLPAGPYRVTVTADTGPPTDEAGKPPPFAGRYTNPEQSDLRVTVGPGMDGRVVLTLEP